MLLFISLRNQKHVSDNENVHHRQTKKGYRYHTQRNLTRTHRGRHGLPQKPQLSRRSSPSRLHQEVLHRGPTRSRPLVRPRPPLLRLALWRPRRRGHLRTASPLGRTDVQRLGLWARRGLSIICQACYHPAASLTAAAGSAHRRDPCSYRLTGPDGANTVRLRPRRAYGNSYFTAYASF